MFNILKIHRKFSICVIATFVLLAILLFFINSCVGSLNNKNHDVYAYTIKIRNAVEELDKIFERSELNVRIMADTIATSYDSSKQQNETYNLNFIDNLDGLTKSTLENSPGVSGSWFQLNANLPFAAKAYNWYEFKDNQFINIKNQFTGTPSEDRKITPEDDPYYYSAISNMGPVWSKIYSDTDTNEPMMTISAPVYKGNILVGVVGIDISVKNLRQVLDDIQNNIIRSDLFLLDQDNNVILAQLYSGRTPTYKDYSFLTLFDNKDNYFVEYSNKSSKRIAIKLTLSNRYKIVISTKDKDIFSDKATMIVLVYSLYVILILSLTLTFLLLYKTILLLQEKKLQEVQNQEKNEEEDNNIEQY